MNTHAHFPWPLALAIAVTLIGGQASVNAQEVQAPEPHQPTVTVAPRAPSLSNPASDVLKMYNFGVDTSVINSFIEAYDIPFALNADDVLYLNQCGLPPELVQAMQRHDASLAEQSKTEEQRRSEAIPIPDQSEIPMSPSGAMPPPPPGADQFSSPTYIENPPPEVATFYDSLAPYGSWIYLNDRGWCWQPSVASVNSDWEPYVDGGRWCNTDDGWYWDSSYEWGWAPFHYGRWWNAPCGWVWFPDTVWAPSWVSWRYSDPYCGWAALPPSFFPQFGLGSRHFGFGADFGLGFDSFFFVGFGNVFDHDLRFHRFNPHDHHEFFAHSTLANGFQPFDGRVRNFGVPADHVAHASGRSIPVIAVNERLVDPTVVRPGIFRDRAGQPTLFRPALPTPARSTSGMVAQEIRGNQRPVTGANSPAFIRDPAGASVGGSSGSFMTPRSGSTPDHGAASGSSAAPTFRAPINTAPRNTMNANPTPRSSATPRAETVTPSTTPHNSTFSAPSFSAPSVQSAPSAEFHNSAPAPAAPAPMAPGFQGGNASHGSAPAGNASGHASGGGGGHR